MCATREKVQLICQCEVSVCVVYARFFFIAHAWSSSGECGGGDVDAVGEVSFIQCVCRWVCSKSVWASCSSCSLAGILEVDDDDDDDAEAANTTIIYHNNNNNNNKTRTKTRTI